uniref:DUF4371 domain-containing protein n=1 Tax=Lactuca sativa TaxID=4236 RepID=A0A9R1XT56_LACSA|nr:hypothetical protein LSAT_V11C100001900 [Lactuca sativa]
MLFLPQQGLAFRGHSEKEDSDNIDLGNDFLAILVDESRDVSCKEQMALILQFVNRKGEVEERFVGLRNVNNTSTLSLKATIYDMLAKWNLSPSRIRRQGYDGASNMSGAFNGLKTLIMNETKSAHFVHCFAHKLQLALVFVAKNHTTVNDFFFLVSRLLNIIVSSYKRRDKLRINKQIKYASGGLFSFVYANYSANSFVYATGLNLEVGIKRPYDTRWGSHFASLLNIQTIYASICDVYLKTLVNLIVIVIVKLKQFASSTGRGPRNHSPPYICNIHNVQDIWIYPFRLKLFDFVLCLHFMVDILGVTDHLNTILQRKDQNIVNAMNQVSSSKKSIQEIRDVGWDPLLEKLKSWIWKINILMDTVVVKIHMLVNNLHHYQVDVFKEVIDMQLQELNNRFNEYHLEVFVRTTMASFNLNSMTSFSHLLGSSTKIPMLIPEYYDQWADRMEDYLNGLDEELWKCISGEINQPAQV